MCGASYRPDQQGGDAGAGNCAINDSFRAVLMAALIIPNILRSCIVLGRKHLQRWKRNVATAFPRM